MPAFSDDYRIVCSIMLATGTKTLARMTPEYSTLVIRKTYSTFSRAELRDTIVSRHREHDACSPRNGDGAVRGVVHRPIAKVITTAVSGGFERADSEGLMERGKENRLGHFLGPS